MMSAAVKANSKEVGGFGYIEEDNGFIIVEKAFMVPQEVSAGEVDFEDTEALPYAIDKSIADNCIEKLRFSWHSHGNMNTFWSGTDENAITKFGSQGTPWIVSVVVNNKGENRARLDIFDVPVVGHQMWEAQLQVLRLPEVVSEVAEQYEKLVTEKTYANNTGNWKGNQNSKGKHWDNKKKDKKEDKKNVPLVLNQKNPTSTPDGTVSDEDIDTYGGMFGSGWSDGMNGDPYVDAMAIPHDLAALKRAVKNHPEFQEGNYLCGLSESQLSADDWQTLADMFNVTVDDDPEAEAEADAEAQAEEEKDELLEAAQNGIIPADEAEVEAAIQQEREKKEPITD